MTNDSQKEKLSRITSEIDDAVDDLFSEYQQVEIDPITNEVRTVSPADLKKKDTLVMGSGGVGLDFLPEDSGEPADLAGITDDIFSQLDHALLSLEWEISRKNIDSTRELFSKLNKKISPTQPFLGKTFDIIDQVLAAIAESPQLVPTSGPKSLKEALAALKKINQESLSQEKAAVELAPIVEGLNNALLGGKTVAILEEAATITIDMDGPDIIEPAAAAPPTKNEETLDLKFDTVEEEKQASKTQSIRSAAPVSYREATASGGTTTGQIPDRLLKVIQANVTMLGMCIDRVLPLENLFANKQGYDKLYTVNKKLREQLELQRESLSRALAGDYQAFPAMLSNPPQAAKAGNKPEPPSTPCPWSSLTVARWKGSLVAFVPDQVSHVSAGTIPSAKFATNLSKLSLKKLKQWPWSSIRELFRGELAKMPEARLQGMELPVLTHPGIFQALTEPCEDIHLLVLFSKETGGVAFIDSGVAEIAVSKQWQWEPEAKRNSILAGHLKVEGECLPVISLT